MHDLILFGIGVISGAGFVLCGFGWWLRAEMEKSIDVYERAVDAYARAVDCYVASPPACEDEKLEGLTP